MSVQGLIYIIRVTHGMRTEALLMSIMIILCLVVQMLLGDCHISYKQILLTGVQCVAVLA